MADASRDEATDGGRDGDRTAADSNRDSAASDSDAGSDPTAASGDRDAGYEARAFALRDRAAEAREAFEPPSDENAVPSDDALPARDDALAFARDGVGEAAAIYIEARMESSWVYFDEDAFDALETGLNAYLELFAAAHGVEDCNPGVTVRTAAETLLDTHDAVDTAAVLTGVKE